MLLWCTAYRRLGNTNTNRLLSLLLLQRPLFLFFFRLQGPSVTLQPFSYQQFSAPSEISFFSLSFITWNCKTPSHLRGRGKCSFPAHEWSRGTKRRRRPTSLSSRPRRSESKRRNARADRHSLDGEENQQTRTSLHCDPDGGVSKQNWGGGEYN